MARIEHISQTKTLRQYRTLYCFIVFIDLLTVTTCVNGQDVHFDDVQGLSIWYNPALKRNKVPLLHLNIRSINYQNIVAYTSKAALIELPITRVKDEDNAGFVNLTAGLNADNGNNGVLKVSTAMLALSYAIPLNYDYTYLAAGFQGAYTFNQVGLNGNFLFPHYFDKYGAIGSAISADPFQSGYQYEYFTAGAGIAVFHSGVEKQWHIGGSIRHFNRPFTEWNHSARLSMNRGIQAGYSTTIKKVDVVSGYGNFVWQDNVHELLIGAIYTRNLDDSAAKAISIGIGYRAGDAFMPNVGLKFGNHQFAFYYELPIVTNSSRYYRRKGLEFSYTLNL